MIQHALHVLPRPAGYTTDASHSVQMMYDGKDVGGWACCNSGFVLVRSNCRTKIFMETMVAHLWISFGARNSDQVGPAVC